MAMVSDALSRSVTELVQPDELASAMADGIRATADDPNLENWLTERVSAALDFADSQYEGTVDEHLAPEVHEALQRLASRPFRVDPALLRSVLGHEKILSMLREGLENVLTSFGRSLLAAMPGTERGQAFAGIFDMAKGVAAMVRAELDRILEGRVQEFVYDTVDRGIEKWTDALSSKKTAERFAQARAELTEILLDQPAGHYIAIPRTADVAAISRAACEEIRALAAWEGLEDEIAGSLHRALEPLEEETLADILDGSGLMEAWRGPVEELLTSYFEQLFESEPFGNWLSRVEAGKPSPRKRHGPSHD